MAGRELSAGDRAARPAAWSPATAALVAGARTALLDGLARRAPGAGCRELLDALAERREPFGDAAYLLEPDLKEARGGLRDMTMLRALAASWLTDRPHAGVDETRTSGCSTSATRCT